MRRPFARGAKGMVSSSWSFLDFCAFFGLTSLLDPFLAVAFFVISLAVSTGGILSSISSFSVELASSPSESDASGEESSFKLVVDFCRLDRLGGESSEVPLLRFRL